MAVAGWLWKSAALTCNLNRSGRKAKPTAATYGILEWGVIFVSSHKRLGLDGRWSGCRYITKLSHKADVTQLLVHSRSTLGPPQDGSLCHSH
jgi:hypothetical protein